MAINIKQNATGAGSFDLVSDAASKVLFSVKERGASFSDLTSKVTLFDDFLGDVIADQWSAAKGSDAQAVIAVVQAGAASGVVRQTTGDTTVVAESCVALTSYLNWKAANGNLVMETKFTPISAVTTVQYFIGFTDTIASGTLEQPFTLSGTTYTSTATDAVGFLFDTDATTDTWRLVGVKNDTDATHVALSTAPAADTAVVLRIELDTAGNATFYMDGALVGTLANAVTPTVALTPIVEAMARTTSSRSIDTDYIFVQQDR